MEWTKYIPCAGDLIILDYLDGSRAGIFIRNSWDIGYNGRQVIHTWQIKWIAQKNKKLPPEWITEGIIFNYLKTGAAKIYKQGDK